MTTPHPPTPQGTHKGCPYNGTNALGRLIRTIVGASLVGALGGGCPGGMGGYLSIVGALRQHSIYTKFSSSKERALRQHWM